MLNYIICFTLLDGYLHHEWNEVPEGRICFQLIRSVFLFDFSSQYDTFLCECFGILAPPSSGSECTWYVPTVVPTKPKNKKN
jgi:hypothetical protein